MIDARRSPLARRPFSLCIITLNEAANLRRCIGSVTFADEVVVLDCGSTDGTAELARELGARVEVEPFRGHVQQKRRAVELARHDWVLCLDADEEVSAPLAAEIERALGEDGCSGYELPRKTHYLGRFIEHGGWWPEYRLRLFDRRRGGWTGHDPHDRVEVEGGVRQLRGPLHHFNYRDVRHHLDKVNSYTSIMAQGMRERGRRFSYAALLLRPPGRFLKMYVVRRGFLDGWRGFLIAAIGGFYVFLKYAKLWELTRVDPQIGQEGPPDPASDAG
jgi:glycosyltransferase involved in cell wall biosynthesis